MFCVNVIILVDRSPVHCMGECECTSFAQCHQTATSYIAVLQYLNKHQTRPCVIPKLKGGKITKGCYHKHHCASAGALHKVYIFFDLFIIFRSLITTAVASVMLFVSIAWPVCSKARQF